MIQNSVYATINKTMKAQLPHPEHHSYRLHRKQAMTQVILPVVLAGILLIAVVVLISFATFGNGVDISRWAAISTMWIFIPLIIGGLVFLIVLVGLVYLFARLLGILPTYTGIAQDYVYKIRLYVLHAADKVVKPVIGFNALIGRVKAFLGRK